MKTIGLPISKKENEKRRALLPDHIQYIKHPEFVYVEKNYGEVLGFSDIQYKQCGIHVVDREEILQKDIICDPKIGDAEYLQILENQTVFGWIHAVQNKEITNLLIRQKLSAYAWEDMYEGGRHVFWRNNEIAGEAAVCHAYLCHGIFPYNTKAAILGCGNVARGALKTLNYMGAEVTVYNRKTEQLFRNEIGNYDVIVNAILWDTDRDDHIIYKKDLKMMKPGSLIIDVSCDKHGGIETSEPTTIQEPIYMIDGIAHYVVDHTPSLFYKTTTESLSQVFVKYVDFLIEDCPDDVLKRSQNFNHGTILDERIIKFQNR